MTKPLPDGCRKRQGDSSALAVASDQPQTDSVPLPDRCRKDCRDGVALPDDCRRPRKAGESLPDGFRKVRSAIHLVAGEGGDMLGRQQRLINAFLGAQGWLERHLDENDLLAGLVSEFTAELNTVRDAATAQALGLRMRKAATTELHDAIRRLREHQLHLIVAIARGHASLADEFAVLEAVRLPRYRMPVVFLVAHARAIRDVVRPFEAQFVQWGCSPGFIAELDAAINEVEMIFGKRNSAMLMQVGATAGLVRHLSDARKVLTAIDASLYPRYRDDKVAWAEWRSVIRVRRKPGRKPGRRRLHAETE